MKKNNQDLSRRDFIKVSASTVAVGATLSFSALRAIAQSKQAGKPILNESSLNKALTPNSPSNARVAIVQAQKQLATEFGKDPKAWITSRFTLTPEQQRRLDSFPKANWDELGKLLQTVQDKGGTITAQWIPSGSSNPNSKQKPKEIKVSAEVTKDSVKATATFSY
ncbi:MAG: twin-arginine translocation signal domain-containing protein [Acidobacteriota bacterium]